MSSANGRFTQQDTFDGFDTNPVSLHKYLYANADPVNGIDPSGNMTLTGLTTGINVAVNLGRIALPIIRAAAIACTAQAITSTGIGYAGAPLTSVSGPCVGNQMRVQLQQGSSGDDVSSVQMNVPAVGVTALQVRRGLEAVYQRRNAASWWDDSLHGWLVNAVIKLSKKLGGVPAAGGISIVGNVMREETYYRGKEFRVDIENLRGHNLRR